MTAPFLSLITVCRNSEKTIRATLDSVLAQGFEDYEYIVVDGASTDGTLAILKEYEPRFAGKMRFRSEPDKGIYDAMNKGIRKAQGEWIGIINSDDNYLPGAFHCLKKTVESSAVLPDVVFSDMNYEDKDGTVVRFVPGDERKLWKGMFVNHPTCFVRGDSYRKYGLFDTRYRIVADYELMLRIRKGGGIFVKAPNKLAVLHTGGISSGSFESELEKHQVQKQYFPPLLCSYCYLRSLYAFKVRPGLKRLLPSHEHQ